MWQPELQSDFCKLSLRVVILTQEAVDVRWRVGANVGDEQADEVGRHVVVQRVHNRRQAHLSEDEATRRGRCSVSQ